MVFKVEIKQKSKKMLIIIIKNINRVYLCLQAKSFCTLKQGRVFHVLLVENLHNSGAEVFRSFWILVFCSKQEFTFDSYNTTFNIFHLPYNIKGTSVTCWVCLNGASLQDSFLFWKKSPWLFLSVNSWLQNKEGGKAW